MSEYQFLNKRTKTMLRIAIVEDNQKESTDLRNMLNQWLEKKQLIFEIDEYSSGNEFIEYFDTAEAYNLVFLDIDMPGKNGMETATFIREKYSEVLLVFVTYMVQYAVQGYAVSACDFIVKTVIEEQLYAKLARIVPKIKLRKSMITIQNKTEIVRLKTADIAYIEVYGRKLIFYTKQGKIESYGSLKTMQETLMYNDFVKCNKCYLVNLFYVNRIEDNIVDVGGHLLQISRREKKHFMDCFVQYDGGM